MINWYRRKAIESCSRAQCNPMLFVVAFVVALGVLTYVYREVILETLRIIAMVVLGAGALALVGMAVMTGIRYHRRNTVLHPVHEGIAPSYEEEDEPVAQSPYESTLGNPTPDGMEKEADWLADEHVTLAWDPNGVLKGGKAR
jgi:hypothetical protein